MSSENRDSFISSFPFCVAFVVLARPSSPMLNKSSESEYPCLVVEFRGKAFVFHPMILTAQFLVDALYQDEKGPLCSQFAQCFYTHTGSEFC